jgi:outer membrane protein TolC
MKTLIFLLLISSSLLAQSVDYNKIILPDNAHTSDFAEKLVQLAWKNHPTNEMIRREVNIAGYEVKKSAVSWLDIIHVQGNLNEFVLNPGNDQLGRAAFFPKYNVRADISLGMFFTIPYTTKQNRERLIVTQSQVNARKLEIRSVVISAYNEYLFREKVFKIQSQLVLDNETSHKLVEQKFKNGEITFENYSLSLSHFSQINIAQLEAEKNYRNAKLSVEQLIGMRLEEVR